MIGMGVIGLRFGAQVHVPAFRADARCAVIALAGRDQAQAVSIALSLGVPKAFSDWCTLLADASVDAVSIALPPAEQAVVIEEAARQGKHVFCEKPMAHSLAAAERVLESVRRARVVHAIDFIFPELPAWRAAGDLIRSGELGALHHFAYTWQVETFSARHRSTSWKNAAIAGGGAVGNFASHALFNLEWLLGPIESLALGPVRPGASDAFCDFSVIVADGVHGIVSIATDAYLGIGHRVEIFGEQGTLLLHNETADHAGGFVLSFGSRGSGQLQPLMRDALVIDGDGRIAPVGRIVRRFLDAVSGGAPASPNLEDGLRVQRYLDRLITPWQT